MKDDIFMSSEEHRHQIRRNSRTDTMSVSSSVGQGMGMAQGAEVQYDEGEEVFSTDDYDAILTAGYRIGGATSDRSVDHVELRTDMSSQLRAGRIKVMLPVNAGTSGSDIRPKQQLDAPVGGSSGNDNNNRSDQSEASVSTALSGRRINGGRGSFKLQSSHTGAPVPTTDRNGVTTDQFNREHHLAAGSSSSLPRTEMSSTPVKGVNRSSTFSEQAKYVLARKQEQSRTSTTTTPEHEDTRGANVENRELTLSTGDITQRELDTYKSLKLHHNTNGSLTLDIGPNGDSKKQPPPPPIRTSSVFSKDNDVIRTATEPAADSKQQTSSTTTYRYPIEGVDIPASREQKIYVTRQTLPIRRIDDQMADQIASRANAITVRTQSRNRAESAIVTTESETERALNKVTSSPPISMRYLNSRMRRTYSDKSSTESTQSADTVKMASPTAISLNVVTANRDRGFDSIAMSSRKTRDQQLPQLSRETQTIRSSRDRVVDHKKVDAKNRTGEVDNSAEGVVVSPISGSSAQRLGSGEQYNRLPVNDTVEVDQVSVIEDRLERMTSPREHRRNYGREAIELFMKDDSDTGEKGAEPRGRSSTEAMAGDREIYVDEIDGVRADDATAKGVEPLRRRRGADQSERVDITKPEETPALVADTSAKESGTAVNGNTEVKTRFQDSDSDGLVHSRRQPLYEYTNQLERNDSLIDRVLRSGVLVDRTAGNVAYKSVHKYFSSSATSSSGGASSDDEEGSSSESGTPGYNDDISAEIGRVFDTRMPIRRISAPADSFSKKSPSHTTHTRTQNTSVFDLQDANPEFKSRANKDERSIRVRDRQPTPASNHAPSSSSSAVNNVATPTGLQRRQHVTRISVTDERRPPSLSSSTSSSSHRNANADSYIDQSFEHYIYDRTDPKPLSSLSTHHPSVQHPTPQPPRYANRNGDSRGQAPQWSPDRRTVTYLRSRTPASPTPGLLALPHGTANGYQRAVSPRPRMMVHDRVVSPAGNNTGTMYRSSQSLHSQTGTDVAIDPDLKDADKLGKDYHITLSLNPSASSRPGSRMSREDMTTLHSQISPLSLSTGVNFAAPHGGQYSDYSEHTQRNTRSVHSAYRSQSRGPVTPTLLTEHYEDTPLYNAYPNHQQAPPFDVGEYRNVVQVNDYNQYDQPHQQQHTLDRRLNGISISDLGLVPGAGVSSGDLGFSTTIRHEVAPPVPTSATSYTETSMYRSVEYNANGYASSPPDATPVAGLSVPVNETLTMGYHHPEQQQHRRGVMLLNNAPEHVISGEDNSAGYVVGSVSQTLNERNKQRDEKHKRKDTKKKSKDAKSQRELDKKRRNLSRIPPLDNGSILVRNQLPNHRHPLRMPSDDYVTPDDVTDDDDDYITDDDDDDQSVDEDLLVPRVADSRNNPFYSGFNVRRDNPIYYSDIEQNNAQPPAKEHLIPVRHAPARTDPITASVHRPVKRTVPVLADESGSDFALSFAEDHAHSRRRVTPTNVSHTAVRNIPVRRAESGSDFDLSVGGARVETARRVRTVETEPHRRDEVDHRKRSKSRGRSKSRDRNLATAAASTSAIVSDGFDQDVNVSRGTYRHGVDDVRSTKPAASRSTDFKRTTTTTSTSGGLGDRQTSSEFDVSLLLHNAPVDSIKQSIKIDREEEEIVGPLPTGHSGDSEDLLNFDTVSEKVELGLENGAALVSVRVRCERIVPIRGAEDLFKKSSVIVTRLIEIDLQATEERRNMYTQIMQRTVSSRVQGSEGHGGSSSYKQAQLSTKDTFKLYKTFMGLAEADEGMQRERMTIDRTLADEHHPGLYLKRNLAEAAAGLFDEPGMLGSTKVGETGYVSRADNETLRRRLERELLPQGVANVISGEFDTGSQRDELDSLY